MQTSASFDLAIFTHQYVLTSTINGRVPSLYTCERSYERKNWQAASAFLNMVTAKDSPFFCSKLNDSTQLVVHRDKYSEFAFVYVKTYPQHSVAVIIDNGCGAGNHSDDSSTLELKDFILASVLNSEQRTFDFLVICTHCHFDHIGGIEAFSRSGAGIVASGHDREFLSPKKRTESSLCGTFNMAIPDYEISHYAQDDESLSYHGKSLGLRIIHTPGHTPDSMAIFDEAERWLFVGDTCYQRSALMPWGEDQVVPIVLPMQGNVKDFIASLHKLHDFATKEDQESNEAQIQLAAGHTTSQRPAAKFLRNVILFCGDISLGKLEAESIPGDLVAPGGSLGDTMFTLWTGNEDTDLSLIAPERFKDDF